jgi:hypothetical protein
MHGVIDGGPGMNVQCLRKLKEPTRKTLCLYTMYQMTSSFKGWHRKRWRFVKWAWDRLKD